MGTIQNHFLLNRTVLIAALASVALTEYASGQAIIGESHVVDDKETPHPYIVAAVPGEVAWSTEIVHKGAAFIKVKFEDFSLAEGDYVIVRDPESSESHRYDATAPVVFWSLSVFSERVIVELHSLHDAPGHGFKIAGYAQSVLDPICEPPMCGIDVECPDVPAAAYPLREPVCAIIYPANGNLHQCSCYQIGYESDLRTGYVLTNKHCDPAEQMPPNPLGWLAAEVWFNSERTSCGEGNLKVVFPYLVEEDELCSDEVKPQGLDYSLLRITQPNKKLPPPETWGVLHLRNGPPLRNELVHRFHHSNGCQKQYTDGAMMCPAANAPDTYWDYSARGAQGSSGSPVIADLDDCVVAHHGYTATSCGQGCVPGKGSEIQDVIAHISANCPAGLPPNVELCEAQEGDPPTPCACRIFNNQAEFEEFLEDCKALKGIEDFEEAEFFTGVIIAIDDPLCGGIPNLPDGSPFPNGLSQLNLCLQSNTLGGNPDNKSPRGVDGLVFVSGPGKFGNSSHVVLANTFTDSLDMTFTDSHKTGVGFDTVSLQGGNSVEIRVYDEDNSTLLAMDTAPTDPAGTNFFGVWCPTAIGRVNIYDPNNGAEGGDNIQLWEGSTLCGNGVLDFGEDCDPPGSSCPNKSPCLADCTCGSNSCNPNCPLDILDANGTTFNGRIDAWELANVLGCWSTTSPCAPLQGACTCLDFDGNGCIDAVDLASSVLGPWGACCNDGFCAERESCADCAPNECAAETWCDDGVDNDCDGLTDCADIVDCPPGIPPCP